MRWCQLHLDLWTSQRRFEIILQFKKSEIMQMQWFDVKMRKLYQPTIQYLKQYDGFTPSTSVFPIKCFFMNNKQKLFSILTSFFSYFIYSISVIFWLFYVYFTEFSDWISNQQIYKLNFYKTISRYQFVYYNEKCKLNSKYHRIRVSFSLVLLF